MSYLVLARKWRPQTFEDLVGQEHVSRTLSNAIAQDRVAHAFLFTGVRGVGKTTSARILAKALNCSNGPTATPCLACSACVEIANGTDMDVQEIDGASYTGVDDVRRLQETIPFRPARDRFKVFIVDEVHMLSTNAWNAFLKTLEEPPPHVKFIFATTEVHKVPITILSRCQRYDFKMIAAKTVAARLRFVLEKEGILADDAAVSLLSREAAGSMRDAMSLLDQAIAWAGTDLRGDEVARVLGVASRSGVHDMVRCVVEGDAQGALGHATKLLDGGVDVIYLARETLAHLRDVTVAKVSTSVEALEHLSQDELQAVRHLASTVVADDLLRIHQGLSRSFDDIARAPLPRSSFEMALVRLSRRPPLVPLDQLLDRLGELERKLGSPPSAPRGPQSGGGANSPSSGGAGRAPTRGGASASGPNVTPITGAISGANSPSSQPGSAPAMATQNLQNRVVSRTTEFRAEHAPPGPRSAGAPSSKSPLVAAANAAVMMQPEPSRVDPQPSARVVTAPLRQSSPPSSQPSSQQSPPSSGAPSSGAIGQPSPRGLPSGTAGRPSNVFNGADRIKGTDRSVFDPPASVLARQNSDAPIVDENPASPPRAGTRVRMSETIEPLPPPREGVDMDVWRSLVDKVRAQSMPLASVLDHAAPLSLNAEKVVLGFAPNGFLHVQLSEANNLEMLTTVLRERFGSSVQLSVELTDEANRCQTLSRIETHRRIAEREQVKKEAETHPLVLAAIEVLGATIRDVKID